MSEVCLTNTTKKSSRQLSSLLLSDLFMFCSLILSHPLYFSYFIFFSPSLLKLLSFLSPLFITTSLLLLLSLLLSVIPLDFPESKPGFGLLLSTFAAIAEKLQRKTEDQEDEEEFLEFEGLEAFRVVFDTSMFELRDNPVRDLQLKSEESCFRAFEEPVSMCLVEDRATVMQEQCLEGFLKEFDEFENVTCVVEEENTVEPPGANPDKVEEHGEEEESVVIIGSEEKGNLVIFDQVKVSVDKGSLVICDEVKVGVDKGNLVIYDDVKVGVDNGEEYTSKGGVDNGEEYTSKITTDSSKLGASVEGIDNGEAYTLENAMDSSRKLGSNLGSYGSMRSEKEWKRTLACKLFEERHNVEGGEGMDSLWETYDTDSSKIKQNVKIDKKKKIVKKKGEMRDEDYDEEDYMDGQLCCLQALKFSSGKMNLGMGKPNLVKISKAIKGIGWLHHLTKHGKKGHN